MKKVNPAYFSLVFFLAFLSVAPAFAAAVDDMATKMSETLAEGPDDGHWQVSPDDVYMWTKMGKKNFVVVDVRTSAERFAAGHVPGAIHVPYPTALEPFSLKKLPKDKKIILVCDTGQIQNLLVVPLRVLGYDAYTMRLGYAAWIKNHPGGAMMEAVVKRAAEKNYPVEN